MVRKSFVAAVLGLGVASGTVALGTAQAAEFRLQAEAAQPGQLAPAQFADAFGCSGGNLSPALRWSGAPAGTRSFVVTMYDPDAPTGSGWWHWVVANLPADVDHLDSGAGSVGGKLPAGALAIAGDTGSPAYFGSCPPPGEVHRYVLTVQALKVERLALPPDARPALVGFLSRAHSLGSASVTLLGGR